jgi:hypothetical protein
VAAAPVTAAGADKASVAFRTSPLTTLSADSRSRLQQPLTLRAQNQQTPTTAESGSFFKTKKGVAVLVLVGGGFAYALYSKSHDRVFSPVR